MGTEHIEKSDKKKQRRSNIKLTTHLIGGRVKDILFGEKPVIIPKEPEKKVEMVDTSEASKILKKLEMIEFKESQIHAAMQDLAQKYVARKESDLESSQGSLTSLLANHKSTEEHPNIKNNMKPQSDAEKFKYKSLTLSFLQQLRDEQKTPLESFSEKEIENLKEQIFESLVKEKDDLVKYAEFLSEKQVLLLYKFMLDNHKKIIFMPVFSHLVKICKKREKEILLHLN